MEGIYDDTTNRLLCGSGISGEFEVNVSMTHERDRPEPIVVYRRGGYDK